VLLVLDPLHLFTAPALALALARAVTRVRPADQGLPDPLAVMHYVAVTTPLLSPFIPLYKVSAAALVCLLVPFHYPPHCSAT